MSRIYEVLITVKPDLPGVLNFTTLLTYLGGGTANWPKLDFLQMAGWPFFALLPAVANRGGLVIKRQMKKLLNNNKE